MREISRRQEIKMRNKLNVVLNLARGWLLRPYRPPHSLIITERQRFLAQHSRQTDKVCLSDGTPN